MDDQDLTKLCAAALAENATKRFTTQCFVCGKRLTQSLHWLRTNKFKCPFCGGNMDEKPLEQLTRLVLQKIKSAPSKTSSAAGRIVPTAVAGPLHGIKKYQLVLQFHADSLDDFDALIELEDELDEALGDLAEVDGHDFGADEANIFIFTRDPNQAFIAVKPVLKKNKCLKNVTAAFRDVEGEAYTVIWPRECRNEFRVL